MKGKNLFLLIDDLDKSEKHKILNTCKRSGDKRHKLLYQLIKKSPKNVPQYEAALDQVADSLFEKPAKTEDDEHEKDKILRRFIDFAIKEVEALKLRELLVSDQKMRNYLLATIYKRPETHTLFKSYLGKSKTLAEKDNDPWLRSFALDHGIILKTRSQKKRDLAELRELLLEKNRLIQSQYHSKLSEVYNLLSGLYLNDKNIINELENLLLADDEIDALVRLSGADPVAIEYKIAQSRFNLEDEAKLNGYLLEAESLLNKCEAEEETVERLRRRLDFLRIVDGFHYGESPEKLREYADRVMAINRKYDIRDGLAAFYDLFLDLLISNSSEKLTARLEEYQSIYFTGENEYMVEFLEAYGLFLDGETKRTMLLLNNLSYAPNFYIAIWSRLLQMRIHYERGNLSLCESLIDRANRQMNVNQGKIFTYSSNAVVMVTFCRLMGMRKPKMYADIDENTAKISPFHQKLNSWFKDQMKEG